LVFFLLLLLLLLLCMLLVHVGVEQLIKVSARHNSVLCVSSRRGGERGRKGLWEIVRVCARMCLRMRERRFGKKAGWLEK